VFGLLPTEGGDTTGPLGAGGWPVLPRGAVVDDVGFFPDEVVVGPVVDVVVAGSGSWGTVVAVVVVAGGAVVVVGRFVVVVVAGGAVVVVGRFVVVVVAGAWVVVVVGASVVVVVGTSVVVVVGTSVVVVVGTSVVVVVVFSGGTVSGGDVGSGVEQSTGCAGSAGGGHSSAPAISVANGPAGPTPDPAAPRRTAAVIAATVIRRWAEDVDTGLTSSRARADPADSRREWSLVRL
jgi:hypothetical protein